MSQTGTLQPQPKAKGRRINVELPEDLHSKICIKAIEEGLTRQESAIIAFTEWVKKRRQ